MKIIYTIVSLIELLLYYISTIVISVKIYNTSYHRLRLELSFLIFIPIIIAEIFLEKEISVIINGIFPCIEILILKLCNKKIRLRSLASIYIFLYLINIIIISCILFFLPPTQNGNQIVELSVNVLSTTLCLSVSYTKLRNIAQQIVLWTPKATKILLLLIFVCCSVLTTLVSDNSIYKGHEQGSDTVRIFLILLTTLLITLVIPVLIIYSVANKHFRSLTDNYKKQIDAQSEHYILLSESNFELRRFRHDYKNMCIGLIALITEGKNDEALKVLEKQNLCFNSSFIKFDTGNGIVDALLTDKQKQADKINTQIKFEGAVPSDAVKPTDLCIIFGNTLDNALEACERIETSRTKTINIDCQCNSGFMFIKISNPIKYKVKIDGGKPLTTKSNKSMHGFGLNSLEKVVKQYNGTVKYECDDNCFKVEIDLELNIGK